MDHVRLVIDVEPIGKGRPRFRGNGDTTYAYTPERTRSYEAIIRYEALAALGGAQVMQGPLMMAVDFYIGRGRGSDIDNLIKAVMDALHGVLYEDDHQIVGVVGRRLKDARNPRVELECWQCDSDI